LRIAVTIISLSLLVVVAFQSCAASVGGSLGNDKSTSGAAAIGFLVALLFLVAGAFAIAFPIVSIVSFALAGIMAITAGLSSRFSDLSIWGFAALILAAMSFFGWREKRKRSTAEQSRVR
jgi:hypothetical protein